MIKTLSKCLTSLLNHQLSVACHATPFDQERIATLIKLGADVNHINKEGYSPLHQAAESGRKDLVSTLLEHGANIALKSKNRMRCNALHMAAQNGHHETTGLLLAHSPESIDFPGGGNSNTALYMAAENGHNQTVETLLTHGARSEQKNLLGELPLSLAARNSHAAITTIFIATNPDIGSKLLNEELGSSQCDLMQDKRESYERASDLLLAQGVKITKSILEKPETKKALYEARKRIPEIRGLPANFFGIDETPDTTLSMDGWVERENNLQKAINALKPLQGAQESLKQKGLCLTSNGNKPKIFLATYLLNRELGTPSR